MQQIGYILFLLINFTGKVWLDNLECQVREVNEGAIVCVCNANYCDTISEIEKIEEGQYLQYTSNKAGARFQKTTGEFQDGDDSVKITIDPDLTYQTIHGFGGAFTDSFGINVNSLSDGARDNLLKSYFSSQGIEYTLCRVPIGGTDFSTRGYSYDDGEEDVNLTNFALVEEDFKYKIPLIKTAKELTGDKLRFLASVWTAPKWMKTNNEYSGFGFIKDDMYQVWANYFIKFFEAYENEEIKFWAVTTGNEPSLALFPFTSINSVGWTHPQMIRWIADHLGPTIRNSKYSDLKILTLDDQRFFLPWYIDLVFANETAKNYVDGVAVHWYWDKFLPATLLSVTHDKFPEKLIISTEASAGDKPWEKEVDIGSWSRGEDYATDIIQNLNNWASGWIDWNMALNTTGGPTYINNNIDSAILVNSTADEFYKQPMYYAIGHFSKFIPVDSVRISTTNSLTLLQAAAVRRPDNGTVVVVANTYDWDIPAVIRDTRRGNIKTNIGKRSINTFIYW